MKKHLPLVLALFCLSAGLLGQQRPIAEIAAELEKIAADASRLAAELKTQEPAEILVADGADLQAALTAAPAGATVRLADGATFVGNFTLAKPVTLVTETAIVRTANSSPALVISGDDVTVQGLRVEPEPGAPTNDVIVIRGARTKLLTLTLWGNGQTKRGIAANGKDTLIRGSAIRQIGRPGQESQAVATWDGTGLTVEDSILEAGSTPFLSGGASPAVANHVPADLLFDRVTFTHPMEWRGKGMVNKTGFELKSARRVIVRNSTIENVWVEGQTGYAITLTASQYGNSPETIVEDVLFENTTIRNVGGGANILGYGQNQSTRPTLKSRNLRFIGNTFTISRAEYGGHGSLMQLGSEAADIVWTANRVTADGDAFIRASDSRPFAGFVFTDNVVNRAGTYGIWTPIGSRGGAWLATVFPGLVLTGNDFTGAHSTFKGAFPLNVWR